MDQYNRAKEAERGEQSNPEKNRKEEIVLPVERPGDSSRIQETGANLERMDAARTFEQESPPSALQMKPGERQPSAPSTQNEDIGNIGRYDEDHQIKMLLDLAAHVGAEKAVETARKLSQAKQISDHALDEFHDRLTGPKE